VKPESHKSLRQFVRYIMVGGFNAVFGYSVFALLTWSFRGLGSYNYMYAAILGNVIAISAAFLGYKWFVFRTRGNYLVEWIRCFGVYGSSALIGLAGLPILVPILRHILHKPERAPYIAGAALMMVTVVFSFLGHKNISFRQKLVRPAAQSGVESLTLGRAGTTTVVHDSKKEFGDGLPTSLPFWDPRKALEYPPIYNLFQRAVGADKPRRAFIAEHIAPLGRARVLEVATIVSPILNMPANGMAIERNSILFRLDSFVILVSSLLKRSLRWLCSTTSTTPKSWSSATRYFLCSKRVER
jgi:putative flippase GtrA